MHLLVLLGVAVFSLACIDAAPKCQDKEVYCRTWKNKGYCKKTYVDYMRAKCQKTCGFCPEVKVPECKNTPKHSDSCERYWKQFCKKSSQYFYFMKKNCKKTCGLCPVVTDPPPTTKPAAKKVCQDEPSKAKNCPQFKPFCKKSSQWFKWMHKNCPKTCKFCRDDCGLRGAVQGRVVGGVEAEAHSWPWSVALLRFGGYFCGGSLIDEEWVLTAAHCIYGREDQKDYMEAVLGEHNRNKKEGSEQTFGISKVVVHKDYSSRTLDSDIAMLKLKKKVTLKKDKFGNPDKVGLVCMPKQGEAADTDDLCYITGWGKTTGTGVSSQILMEAEMPTVTNAECSKLNTKWGGTKITKKMLCAGQAPGTITSGCHGDSGGPYVCNKARKWVLTGAVSWGSSNCDRSEKYTVFARVSEFRDWIDNVRHTN